MNFEECILTINGGSSSIKFSVYRIKEPLRLCFHGALDYIGSQKAKLAYTNADTGEDSCLNIEPFDHEDAANCLIDWAEKQEFFHTVTAIGHRIVHGMQHTKPQILTPELIKELNGFSAFDPEHLPVEIKLIEIFSRRYPSLKQVACFDTSFHTTMPVVAKLLSIPRRYYEMGIQRFGFHGLSYAYLMEELENIAGEEIANSKIVLAQLGSGASLAAVKDKKSIDTSMGFTPTAGLPMGTRSGDLDPGVAWYLMQFEKLDPKQFSKLINHESGLLGLSETSSDMRELIAIKDTDTRAAEAIEFFCYQTKKWIGSFAAALGGLDVLVFSGGIGEHSPEVRSKICDGLEFLGIELDEVHNMNNQRVISTVMSKVKVYVIKTNEELMIAKLVSEVLFK